MYTKRNKYLPTVDDIEFCVGKFNNCRTLSENPQWKLPEPADLYSAPQYQVKFLQELQESLLECKTQLNTFKREDWRLHTKKRNLTANLMYTMRSNNLTELPIQSWGKLWAILHRFEVIPEGIDRLKSVHLCEAPGAFISALNHYLKQNRPNVHFDWLATSLNPYYEDMDPAQVINDDRIIRHTLDRWVFGPDNTGNLFNPDLVEELKRRSGGDGKVLLVTADGSQDNVQSHELVVLKLLMAEALTALKILSKGGHFVMKIFTALECPTINLVYLLCSAFDSVHMFKPVASREATSETYLVCMGYRYGREDADFQDYLRTIEALQADEARVEACSLFPFGSIAKEFQKSLLEAMRYFAAAQEEVINANIASFPYNIYVHEWNRRKFVREEIERRFFKAYPLQELCQADRLCPFVEGQLEKYEIDNSFQGSWEEEHVLKGQMSSDELTMQLRREFEIVKHSFEWPFEEAEQVIRGSSVEGEGEEEQVDPVKIIRGARIGNIQNSRFITKRLLNFMHKVLELDLGQLEMETAVEMTPRGVQVSLPLGGFAKGFREHENDFVDQLLINLRTATKGTDLVFKNVLLIGQRSVALLYLMAQVLRGLGETELRVNSSGELIFTRLTEATAGELIKELEKWQPLMTDETIHSLVDIRVLRDDKMGAFYDLVKIFNIFCCVQICEKLFE